MIIFIKTFQGAEVQVLKSLRLNCRAVSSFHLEAKVIPGSILNIFLIIWWLFNIESGTLIAFDHNTRINWATARPCTSPNVVPPVGSNLSRTRCLYLTPDIATRPVQFLFHKATDIKLPVPAVPTMKYAPVLWLVWWLELWPVPCLAIVVSFLLCVLPVERVSVKFSFYTERSTASLKTEFVVTASTQPQLKLRVTK